MLDSDPSHPRTRGPLLSVTLMIIVAVVYLRLQGRIWWCQQHDWSPISIAVNSRHNSQHLFDAYSFSHLLHGILFFGLFWFFRRHISFA